MALAAILLAGCSTHYGVSRIRVQHSLVGPEAETFRRMVELFNQEHNGKVQVEATYGGFSGYLRAKPPVRNEPSRPDVILYSASQVPAAVARGAVEPLDELAQREEFNAKDLLDAAREPVLIEGKLYAVPLDGYSLALFYNVKAVEQAGLNPGKPPSSREDLLAWAKTLTADTDGDGKVDRCGLAIPADNVVTARIWYSWFCQNGGRFLDSSGRKCQVNSPQGVQALQFAVDLARAAESPPGESDPEKDFAAGRAAMILQGPWAISEFAARDGLRFRTARFPTVFGKPAVWAGEHCFSVSKQAEVSQKRAAMVFIKWMSDKSWMWAQSGQIPARKSILKSKKFTGSPIYAHQKPFIDQLSGTVQSPAAPALAEVFGETGRGPLAPNIEAAMSGRESPKQALDAAAAEVDRLLAKR